MGASFDPPMEIQPKTSIEVRADQQGSLLNIKELWDYKFLMLLFIRRDFVAKYKQNALGPLWFILQPLLMTGVFSIIFGRIAGIPTDGIPPMLFYLSGLAIWNYFAQTFTVNSSILLTQAPLYTKVYFPRLSLPVANTLSNILAFVVQLLLFLGFYAYFKVVMGEQAAFGVSWVIWLTPLFLGIAGMLALGLGLWMSALTAKYRDLVQLSAFFVQIAMYLTPVVYPLSEVSGTLKASLSLNPMTVVVEGFRLGFLGEGSLTLGMLLYALAVSGAVLLTGILMFQKVQRSFADSI